MNNLIIGGIGGFLGIMFWVVIIFLANKEAKAGGFNQH